MLARADNVVFVEGGQVVAEGSHTDLLASHPRYAATVTQRGGLIGYHPGRIRRGFC